ncbi:MAG: ATP-dependent zinc metalloprotease FtsH [Crocosphaera sp.]|nr:ATP-dependent zinc metalloprotease FtsH [Crocosphaera sp.]
MPQLNNKSQPDFEKRNWLRPILIVLMWLLIFNLFFTKSSEKSLVSYSEFIKQVESGEVAQVEIGTEAIEYTLKAKPEESISSTKTFVTIPVAQDTELPKRLQEHHVEFSARPANHSGWIGTVLSWVIPPLIFILLWIGLLSASQSAQSGVLTVGKSQARIYSQGDTGVTFKDVAGVDEAKEELEEIVDFLEKPEKYISLGAKIPKGVLLVGPPGTGKTLLAKAIAGEARVPFFSISGSEFIELFVGIGASRVRDLFQQAKMQAPCIVFIDELDALGKHRSNMGAMISGNDEREQTLNQLLSEMDGFDPNTGVILLAATNRPDVLDPALLRPGRFDRQVVVDRPDKSGRLAILQVHSKTVKLGSDVDLETLAARTPGFAGADLANLINEAALLAARKNRQGVMMADLNEASERIVTGLEKKSRVLNELEKQTVAYHEVGHALIAALMPGSGKVEKISIVPRGIGALGYTLQLPTEDRFLMLESEIRGRIATLLGGRAAESVLLGRISTGASDDLQQATDLAERFVTLYGMSKKLGPVAFEKGQPKFLEGYANPRRAISPKIAEVIDSEVKEIMDVSYEVAQLTLAQNRDLLQEMAEKLLENEVLEGDVLKAFLEKVVKPEFLEQWEETGLLSTNNLLDSANKVKQIGEKKIISLT